MQQSSTNKTTLFGEKSGLNSGYRRCYGGL